MKISIKLIYLYLFSFVGLLIAVIGSIQLVNFGIKTFILKDADRYVVYEDPYMYLKDGTQKVSTEEAKLIKQQREMAEKVNNTRQRQREMATAVSMILVGTPLYLYHWKKVQKEDR